LFEVVEAVDDADCLTDRERFWQESLKATGEKGLNCKLVTKNCHSGAHSYETRKLMSESAAGRKHTDESKEKMRAAKIGKKMPEAQRLSMVGRKLSAEQVEKLRKRMTGNQNTKGITPHNAKKVICLKTGVIYKKLGDAALAIGLKAEALGKRLRGTQQNNTSMRYL